MAYNFRDKNYSNRRLGREYEEQESIQTPVPKFSQFKRMYSTSALQTQVIPEEENMAKAKRLLFSHNKSSSDPTRFSSNPIQERTGWSTDYKVNGVHSREDTRPAMTVPTLPLLLVLTIVITFTCCYLSDYLPSITTTNYPTQLSDYSIIWALSTFSDKMHPLLQLSSGYSWVLVPAFIGLSVTTITLVILNIDKVGGEKVESYPSLHLGEVVAVMNGLLMFLYFLFYNIRVEPEEQVAG